MGEKMVANGRDRGGCALQQRMSMPRVADRRTQRFREGHSAVIAQQQHEGIEASGHAWSEQPSARDEIEAQLSETRDGGGHWGWTLAANHLGAASFRVVDDDRHVPARAIEMRLDDLQGKRGCDSSVESVAAALEHSHAHRRRDPLRAGDDAECPLDLRPRCEQTWVDETHSGSELHQRIAQSASARIALASGAATLEGGDQTVRDFRHVTTRQRLGE